MDHDFIIKKLIKEIHEAQEKVDCVDGFHNAMYHRGRIEGLKSAIDGLRRISGQMKYLKSKLKI